MLGQRWTVSIWQARSQTVFLAPPNASSYIIIRESITLAVAPVLDVPVGPDTVLALIPLLLILSFSLSALGLLIGARMRSQQGFQLLMQLVILPMFFLSGMFFPVSQVSRWLEVLSKLNPVTYGIDATRQAFVTRAEQHRRMFWKPGFPFHYGSRNPAAWAVSSSYKNADVLPSRFGYLRNCLPP